jgi:crotonobetainyl-CoA:carnitine CoA-transferase CaiB-like acyl-CoA transferase
MSVWTSTGEGPVNPRAWFWLAMYCAGLAVCVGMLWAVTEHKMTGLQVLMCATLAAALYVLPRQVRKRWAVSR